MLPEEQRIALAEACPGVFLRPTGAAGWNYNNSIAGRVLPCIDGDPLKDLNAIYEAEKKLPCGGENSRYERYSNLLRDRFNLEAVSATAIQRVEAVLCVTGRWK